MPLVASRPLPLLVRNWPRFLAYSLLGVLIVVVVVVGLAVHTSLTAEWHLQAMINAVDCCRTFVEQNDGAWPRSWEDIDTLHPEYWNAANHEMVVIDFHADPAQLAKQDGESFSGIRPVLPVFETYEWQLQRLIESLQQYHNIE